MYISIAQCVKCTSLGCLLNLFQIVLMVCMLRMINMLTPAGRCWPTYVISSIVEHVVREILTYFTFVTTRKISQFV